MELSGQDQENLKSIEAKQVILRDRVKSVVRDYATGLWVHGKGGTGKSYAILDELNSEGVKEVGQERVRKQYKLETGRCTARALFDLIKLHPYDIIVLEDCETLLQMENTLGILRAALWSQSQEKPPCRLVTWKGHRVQLETLFYGGIILTTNKEPRKQDARIEAICTRIPILNYALSNEEIASLMRKIASCGYGFGSDFIKPDEASEIAETIIKEALAIPRDLDLRVLINTYRDYLQAKNKDSATDWKGLMQTRLMEHVQLPQKNRERLAEESKIAQQISKVMNWTQTQKLEAWKKQTGKEKRAFYEALQRVS